MKKLVLFLLSVLIGISYCYAIEDGEDIVPTDSSEINLELSSPVKSYNTKRKELKYNSVDISKDNNDMSVQDYSLSNPNKKRTYKVNSKKKIKDFSVGSQSSHTTTYDTYSGTNTMYAEYEKKNFKLNSGYTKTTIQNQDNQDKGSVSLSPEYKLNNHFSLQNKNSTNLNDNSQKTELNLKVTPFKDDRMDFGVGVGQKYSQNAPSSSQFGFTTNLKF